MDKAAALKAIENFLHAEARAGRRCLLVVDEAQNLTVDALEELRMLSNFQLGSTALLQIFLLGQPEFRNLLQSAPELEQLRQRVIATHHLEAMDADEVQPYIEHRLQCAGWTGRPQLTADAYDALYNETGGVPRKLNAVMNRCLLMGAVEQTDTIDGALVGAVIVDMNGKPFEYDATMASQAPFAEPVATKTAPVAAMAQPVAAAADTAHYQALASRIDQLEARMASQDVTMRRVLAMLIDWMEKENQSLAARMRDMRAA
jgi:uncharacterized coiled-coil protein SlyX